MKNFNKAFIKNFILSSLIISQVVFAQTMNIKGVTSPPTIDGTIKVGEYPSTDKSDSFIQLEPFNGNSSLVFTKLYSAYDEKFIYFGIVCYDPEPKKIVSSIQLRDNLSDSDDAIFIILDTYKDHRSAFVFGINPIGTQTDLRIR